MESVGYDAWEEKTRRQFKEGAESRRLYQIAADPRTPAPALEAVAADALRNFTRFSGSTTDAYLVVLEALAGNPNAPPHLLADLIGWSPFSSRAFCLNPVTPFLLLEQPGFVADLTEQAQYGLLREADAPPLFVQMLAEGGAAQSKAVQQAARLHVAFKGTSLTLAAWRQALYEYWWNELVPWSREENEWYGYAMHQWLGTLWAVCPKPLSPSTPLGRFPALDTWFRFAHTPGSPEEAAILKRIGPKMEASVLARGLGRDATAADLQTLLHTPGSDANLITLAILRHPSVSAEIIAEVAGAQGENYQQVVVRHPQTPTLVLLGIQAYNIQLRRKRRKARVHPNQVSANIHLRRLAGFHPNAVSAAPGVGPEAFIKLAQKGASAPAFASCVAQFYGMPHERDDLPHRAEHYHWAARLEAALLVDGSDEPLPDDPAKCTGLDLLNYLSHDGNRIVRATAQKRLADPAYQFFLASPNDEGKPPP